MRLDHSPNYDPLDLTLCQDACPPCFCWRHGEGVREEYTCISGLVYSGVFYWDSLLWCSNFRGEKQSYIRQGVRLVLQTWFIVFDDVSMVC